MNILPYCVQCDEFHDSIKKELRGKVELYRGRLSKEKWEDYYKEVTEYLDEELKKLIQPVEEDMKEFARDTIERLQGVVYKHLYLTTMLYAHKGNWYSLTGKYAQLTSIEEPQTQQYR